MQRLLNPKLKMKLLFQQSLRSSTRSVGGGRIEAEAVLLSTDAEMVARITVTQDTFLIEKAERESLRSGSLYVSSVGGANLIGKPAYFGVAASLTRAFPDAKDAIERSVFAECIKALIQSECYLFRERGFADKQAYQKNWDISHPNSCRYYSHLDRVSRRWFEYIGDEPRKQNLFNRHKSIAIWQSERGTLEGRGTFLDSFHELGIQAQCEADGTIVGFTGSFLRAPDSICFGTAEMVTSLAGRNLNEFTRKEMNRCAGGPEGCAHLLDLGQDLLATLQKTAKLFDAAKR